MSLVKTKSKHLVNKEKQKQAFIKEDEKIKNVVIQNDNYENQIHLPFHLCVLNKQIRKIKQYLNVGYDVNTEDLWGRTALYYAVFSGSLNVIKLLINAGGNYNFTDIGLDNASLLHLAATEGHMDIVKFFIEELHFDVNILDDNGFDALLYSMLFEQLEVAEYLIYHGVNYENVSLIEDIDILIEYLLKQLDKLKDKLKNKRVIYFEDISKIQKFSTFIKFCHGM